jgi:hypothetical protein
MHGFFEREISGKMKIGTIVEEGRVEGHQSLPLGAATLSEPGCQISLTQGATETSHLDSGRKFSRTGQFFPVASVKENKQMGIPEFPGIEPGRIQFRGSGGESVAVFIRLRPFREAKFPEMGHSRSTDFTNPGGFPVSGLEKGFEVPFEISRFSHALFTFSLIHP